MSSSLRSLVLALSVASFGIGASHAQTAITGLGQSWPNATDVSTSPNYHVYVFQRGSLKYIQVNDAGGTVRAAIVRTPTSLLGSPVGVDAANVATPDEPMAAPASTVGETVYKDDAVQVFVAPQTNGSMRVAAAPVECKNPLECSTRGP